MSKIQHLPALLFLLMACTSVEAEAVRYGASLHESQWGATSSRMQCTLLHKIPGYGTALFTQNAGEPITFSLRPRAQLPEMAKVQLVSVAPAWRHGQRSKILQNIPATKDRSRIDLNSRYARQLLHELTQGMAPAFNYPDPDKGHTKVVTSLSPVQLAPALSEFTTCTTTHLLPYSYPQIRQSQFYFDFGSSALLPETVKRADQLVEFIQENSDIRKIRIDGHTDNVGRSRYNRNLGQQRAEAFKACLLAKGIAEEMITLKSYGERKPRASNKTAEGRAANRRILVTLER